MPEPNSKSAGAVGAAVYSRLMLAAYDLLVHRITGPFAFGCSTKKVLFPFFSQHFSKNHLDIGVGTGYFLANTQTPPDAKITLMDLNQNCLDTTSRRLGGAATRTVLHDALLPLPFDDKFDSISLFYLLHCLPSPVERKLELFTNLKRNISPTGVIYGASVLGQGVKWSWFGSWYWPIMLKNGVMDNKGDNEEAFARVLGENFERVELRVEGTVLLFVASEPKKDSLGGRKSVDIV
ncbi:N-methyltransferase vrtF [Lachnellula suecica]|uniref:N-methyltransferase vrtF n=1 Tax=Lachnellula suecica TaxID=602035 RepID=A0A8T9C831_9HELO|nr:N-methyltransferase vrtF [Lachnellula suecica]